MQDYIGKKLKIKTGNQIHEGKMSSFNVDDGKIVLENAFNKKQEFKFDEVTNISLLDDDSLEQAPLKQSEMYAMFHEAFNIYGPTEDQYIYIIAVSLKKFFRDISTATIKIIIESDDVFGRIGLSFARFVLNKAQHVSVELRCELYDLNSLKYKNSFENSGGYFDQPSEESKNYGMILFATNRGGNYDLGNLTSTQILFLDIPESPKISNFVGLGLGFIPENFHVCNKIYYLIDVGFGLELARKYKLPFGLKNNMIKMEINK